MLRTEIRRFEQDITPLIMQRAGKLQLPKKTFQTSLNDLDLITLARHWKDLSSEFKQLYLSTLSIPDNFLKFISPSNNFEVYYTLTGDSAVASTDTYGFSTTNWRQKVLNSNGIPDYVDEVAWALDSSWSMEINRFGYSLPLPITDNLHPSGRYKVVLLDLKLSGSELYGMTYPTGMIAGGLQSYIEIRNDWSNPVWGRYVADPKSAAYITCAHEFFHAIQYAMGHDDQPSYIDSFPGAWLEGTAVMMEELGFDHVNDYLQYFQYQDGYFGRPELSVLSDKNMSIDFYANSVVALYLYQRAFGSSSMGFIKAVFEQNKQNKIEFDRNLNITATNYGQQWTNILNQFHTTSFFTAERADTTRFIKDGSLLPAWYFEYDQLDNTGAVEKQIRPYAMERFGYQRTTPSFDTLFVQFSCATNDWGGKWAASIILKDTAGSYSTRNLPAVSQTTAQLQIEPWRRYDEAIVVVTNGDASLSRTATVHFTGSQIEYLNVSSTFECYPNPIALRSAGMVRIYGQNIVDVSLYTLDSKLVASADIYTNQSNAAIIKTENGFNWQLRNRSGNMVAPGTYIAVVGYVDSHDNSLKRNRQKILVLP